MKHRTSTWNLPVLSFLWVAIVASATLTRAEDGLIGIWTREEAGQSVAMTFRRDGRYQVDTRSTDTEFGFSFSDRGRYEAVGSNLDLTPYEYLGEPESKRYEYRVAGDRLILERPEFSISEVYQFQPGSREEVLAQETVERDPVGRWVRRLIFSGTEEYTFRPGGYYVRKSTFDDGQLPPEYVRGRYSMEGDRLTIHPYSGVEAPYEADFFGGTLTLIRREPFSGGETSFEKVPGSGDEVRAKADEAEAFLSRPGWQVGVWEVRDPFLKVDLTFRPDGRYVATNHSEFVGGTVRGRYELEPRRLHLRPYVGQGPYARSNGEFGKVEHTREIDYYDGELQVIDLGALSQSVTIARKVAGSDAPVIAKMKEAEAIRATEGWHLGIWEVRDPLGWMEFTFRPDRRYIAKQGENGVPGRVERGQYVVTKEKVTLAPYEGLGGARGFEIDLYDGDLFLVGDTSRMVIARKVNGSEAGVIAKTRDPAAMKGERGGILGRWTSSVPGQSTELVFRPDGEFRLDRCAGDRVERDYGVFTVDPASRTAVLDSRFSPVRRCSLDFYGDTMTIHGGGFGGPSTYRVNLGVVDAAIEASHAADLEREQVDDEWLARVPIGPRDPGAVQGPVGDIPADPFPGRVFDAPTVFDRYQLYRRLVPGFVYFNVLGVIKSVAVVNTREWHFFPTGRVLVRFKNYFAGPIYPTTLAELTDSWGAYRVTGKPTEEDVLHRYADNGLFVETDSGESAEMTLEDGRRHLFWEKDYLIQSEWAAEQKPVPCRLPNENDPSLMNTGIGLSSSLPADPIPGEQPILLGLGVSNTGDLVLRGMTDVAGTVVIDRAVSLVEPVVWRPLQTNEIGVGTFSLPLPRDPMPSAYFRVRRP